MDYQTHSDGAAQSRPAVDGSDYVAVQAFEAPGRVVQTLELHPLCTLFPRMGGTQFSSLRDDIKANGLQEDIILLDGMVLDGGNRYRACIDACVEPKFRSYNGNDPVQYVLTKNLLRRHLTAGQRSIIVALVANWNQAQTHGGSRKDNQKATLPLEAVAARATRSESCQRTQKDADKVAREAPALASKVAAGEISLPQAIRQVRPTANKAKPTEAEKLRAENAHLRDRIDELEDSTQEACSIAADLTAIATGVEAERMADLRRQLAISTASLDVCMIKSNELAKQCKALQRRLDKLVVA